MKLVHAAIGSLVLCVSSCATAPTDIAFDTVSTTFDQGEADAVLIIAVGPIATGGGMKFQRLNEDRTDFEGDPIMYGFGAWGVGDKMRRPEGDETSLWVLDQEEINFLLKSVPSGTYAATYVTWNLASPVSQGVAWNCRTEGAFTFNVEPGAISIVSSVDAFPPGTISRLSTGASDTDILEQFARTRVNYPGLQGEPQLVPPTGEVRWEEFDGGVFANDCERAVEGSLSYMTAGQATQDAPDAGDAAAIAAAMRNLENANTNSEDTE